ncbi:hypothetical protein QBC38DRAFT_454103 [Podospora fimiseda]|uniref:RING-type domain-containing protein n=1 Tax=Podospora fimiseda TaxID=252190 RepID=A0AAN7BRZ7_9PEZI|nr:hypothetical protein QBC38DRAFT_454103 [Podospora fimiseda]
MSMSVDEIRNVVLLFSNPSWAGAGTVSSTIIRNVTNLSSEIAYSTRYTGNTTVLSTRFAGTTNGVIQGLLYVPSLSYDHPCAAESSLNIPSSAVRQNNLPPTNYHLIALAPWVSPRCAKAYMTAARTAPVRGFIFYVPGNSTEAPPSADDPLWVIEEEDEWRAQTGYPVYAVSAVAGQAMMQHISLYSGNLTEVPYGQNISERFKADPADYARIWTELSIRTPPSGFATWLYVLIVLGVLLVVIATASFLMHFAQARRRAALRRRVQAGEVNLEAMGIKRLTVPMDHIQGFPLFTYYYEPDVINPPTSPQSPSRTRPKRHSREQHSQSGDSIHPNNTPHRGPRSATLSMYEEKTSSLDVMSTSYQPFCEICLEPYQNRVTIIRELACGHIFHPECVDEFLHEVSSLCPLCKASMLPSGFCPKITNGMVRRERAIRQIRGRIDDDMGEQQKQRAGSHLWRSAFRGRLFAVSPSSSTSTELQETKAPSPSQQQLQQSATDGATSNNNRALARERMREFAGTELDDDGRDDTADNGSTRWKRMRNKVFPGFH